MDRHPSIKTRWLILRARLSMPGLLTRFDEQHVMSLATAVNGGLAILTVGLFAWLTNLPVVFPALGPSAFILFSTPLSSAAAPRSVILGHFSAIVSGCAVWHLISALAGAPVSMQAGGWPPFCSASLALAVSSLLLVRLSCKHPPACASSLVIALGAVTHWYDLVFMALAVVWITAQAVAMNRLAGLPVPVWSPRRPTTP
jgi:CBS-domain-containing membrane protein